MLGCVWIAFPNKMHFVYTSLNTFSYYVKLSIKKIRLQLLGTKAIRALLLTAKRDISCGKRAIKIHERA